MSLFALHYTLKLALQRLIVHETRKRKREPLARPVHTSFFQVRLFL